MDETSASRQVYPYALSGFCEPAYTQNMYKNLNEDAIAGKKKCLAVASVVEQTLNAVTNKINTHNDNENFDALAKFDPTTTFDLCSFFETPYWATFVKPRYERGEPPSVISFPPSHASKC